MWLATLVAGALSGCAIQTPHLNISNWPVENRASYYRQPAPYRIVVLPFSDHRPASEQHGQQPRGWFLLLWNQRVGDYYTADRLFDNNVERGLADRLVAYLQSANVFTQVIGSPQTPARTDHLDPATVQQLSHGYAADYILRGDLQHFYGSQHQHFSMLAVPLYFVSAFSWQNAKSLPWGQTATQFMLYDGRSGDLIWRHRFEASHTMPRETDSMAEAAMESFLGVADGLAVELRQLPFSSRTEPTP